MKPSFKEKLKAKNTRKNKQIKKVLLWIALRGWRSKNETKVAGKVLEKEKKVKKILQKGFEERKERKKKRAQKVIIFWIALRGLAF